MWKKLRAFEKKWRIDMLALMIFFSGLSVQEAIQGGRDGIFRGWWLILQLLLASFWWAMFIKEAKRLKAPTPMQ